MTASTKTRKPKTRATSRSSKARRPPSRGKIVCDYIERNLVHSLGDFYGQPFKLTPEQRRFIWHAYELRPSGKRRYKRVLRGRPKGDGKTELAAAIGCVELALAGQHGFPASPLIPVAAASFEQADLLFGASKLMISEGPLAPYFEVFDTEILRKDGPGRMFRVAAAAGTNDGLRPTFFLADELHEWVGNKERVHLVLANGLAKRAESWELNISTAGSDKETLLGQMYEYGQKVQSGEVKDDSFLFDWLEAPEGLDLDDPKQLEQAVRASNPHADKFWPVEGVLRRYHEIPRFEFERYHLNRWTEANDAWISPSEWDACAGSPEIPAEEPCYVGVDIGGQKDSSAIVAAAFVGETLHVEAKLLTPTEKRKVAVAEVRAELVEMSSRLTIAEVAYDPFGFRESAEDLEEQGLPMVPFDQNNARMSPASETLYELIRGARLEHDGDPEYRSQVLAAVAARNERGWRISKRKSRKRIDACVATAMAADRAMHGDAKKPSRKAVFL